MPITRRQFELEIDTKTEEWMGKIQGFLSQHKEEAFTGEELREALSVSDNTREWKVWDAALDKLVEVGEAEKRIIRGMDYYSYREPFL